ncbi:DUF2235 domain-containing protein [Azospirillum sp. ST 5-10]|uniref:DUF2235 domain-containing protein n=1 Tax=unclassified Azospirillum TaxID=2630922 RepID=UPI003F4A6C8C
MPKRIVLCFDGTWNSPASDELPADRQVETNVRRFFEAVRGDPEQVTFYDEGVGTRWWDRVPGGAFGIGLDRNICDGYDFLVRHHEPDSSVFILGFSRGAYTARSLVGMIRNAGLLPKKHRKRIPQAYELYRTRDGGADTPTALHFRKEYQAKAVAIDFLGVWDTVGALGIPLQAFDWFNRARYSFHDTELSGIVRHAYHALATDEFREDYQATLWDPKRKPEQTMEQRWFVGAHADVGGGYPDRALSDIALRWMMEKAVACGLSLADGSLPDTPSGVAAPDPTDSYSDFLGGAYRLFRGPHRRQVCLTRYGEEDLHDTLVARLAANAGYSPKNPGLREAYQRRRDGAAG